MAKKTNPYPLIVVFDASKIPPVNAQKLLENFKFLLEKIGNSGCRFRKIFLNFERYERCILSDFLGNSVSSFYELKMPI